MVEQAGFRRRVEVESQLDGMGVVGDRTGVLLPIDPGQAADLEDLDRRLLASQVGIARVDHLVVLLQGHERGDPQLMGRGEIGNEGERLAAGSQGLLMLAIAEVQPRAFDVVAGPPGRIAGLEPDGLLEIVNRGRALLGARIAAAGVEQGPAAMDRGPDGGIGRPVDRLAKRPGRQVELPAPLVQLGQGQIGLVRLGPEPDGRLEIGE